MIKFEDNCSNFLFVNKEKEDNSLSNFFNSEKNIYF